MLLVRAGLLVVFLAAVAGACHHVPGAEADTNSVSPGRPRCDVYRRRLTASMPRAPLACPTAMRSPDGAAARQSTGWSSSQTAAVSPVPACHTCNNRSPDPETTKPP